MGYTDVYTFSISETEDKETPSSTSGEVKARKSCWVTYSSANEMLPEGMSRRDQGEMMKPMAAGSGKGKQTIQPLELWSGNDNRKANTIYSDVHYFQTQPRLYSGCNSQRLWHLWTIKMIQVNKNTQFSQPENNHKGTEAEGNGYIAQVPLSTKPQSVLWSENILKIYKGMLEQCCKILFFDGWGGENNWNWIWGTKSLFSEAGIY